jgi:hypothetical protein
LLIREEKLGLLESLVLEVLKNWFWHNITYREANTPVPESSDRGARESKGGQVSSMTMLMLLGRRWRGVSPTAEPHLGRATVRAR